MVYGFLERMGNYKMEFTLKRDEEDRDMIRATYVFNKRSYLAFIIHEDSLSGSEAHKLVFSHGECKVKMTVVEE